MVNKRTYSKPIAFVLTLLLIFSMFAPIPYVYAANDVTNILTSPDGTGAPSIIVTQGGKAIDDISPSALSTSPIAIKISFGVPVIGDDPDNSARPVVKKGDVATFKLSDAFTIAPTGKTELRYSDGTLVGHVEYKKSGSMVVAEVTFDGEDRVFNGIPESEGADPIRDVNCEFGANFQFDKDFKDGEWGNQYVVILDKTYIVNVPAPEIKYTMTKSGAADLAAKEITWTVTASAVQGSKTVDLKGYEFYDDLKNVGDYINGSFQVNGSSQTPEISSSSISYTFADSTSPQAIITFKTTIDEDHYFANSEQTVRNTAEFHQGEITVKTATAEAKFTPKWIEKAGAASDKGSGQYNPKGRTITWTITANHSGASLNGVVITDALQGGLTVDSAVWQAWDGTTWGAIKTLPTTPTTSQYAIGNINSMVLLTIVANVPDDDYTTGTKTYSNSACIRWDGSPGNLGTGNVNVGIGYNAITKSGTADLKERKIHWTVTVNTKEQAIPNMKVYDLLVYGTSGSGFNINTVDGIPGTISGSALTPRYDQQYVDGSFSGSTGLSVTVHPLTQGGVRVADLLEITGLSQTATNTFTFDSLVVNPDIFASNNLSVVRNTATLFSANAKLNAADASATYDSKMLGKEMLKNGNVSNPAAAVNTGKTTNASEGFDYIDKSVIFRLSVNANSIDLTGAENASGEKLGKAIVTDTLPEGWEFVDIVDGEKYLIFEGNPGASASVTAKDTTPLDSVGGLTSAVSGQTATFTFSNLDKPYVILVKAKPISVAGYFDGNKTTTVTNQLKLKTENWTPGESVKQDVSITSNILGKNNAKIQAGELKWTVEYKPYDLPMKGKKLEDTLPIGIDLRISSTGALLLEGNIKASEMVLKSDGSYAVATEVALKIGENITYNNSTRVLSFMIPDSTKAYRFEYITDVTGEPGTIKNEVLLYGVTSGAIDNSKPYTIVSADGSATMQKSGWISITKKGDGGANLSGAAFKIFTEDGTTVIREGKTGSDGTLKLRGIPVGNYIIRETAAPAGYNLKTTSYKLSVTASPTITVSIDGKTGPGSNSITVLNVLTGTVGDLRISKTVAGNAADKSKAFTFTVTFSDGKGYPYVDSDNKDGTIQSGETITLSDGQYVTITEIPQDVTYSAIEKDYSSEGYVTTKTGDSGTIVADSMQTAHFINTKNTSGGGGGGGTTTKPGITTEPGITTGPGVATKPAITTPEAVYGSIRIVKVDGENTSRTLSGAVFQLFNESGKLIQTSAATGSDGVAVFSGLEAGQKYYLKEMTAPAGYQSSGQPYSFQLSKDAANRDVSVAFRNTKEGNVKIIEIDPEEVPKGWIIEEEKVPTGGLDTTPKTGSSDTPLLMVFSLTALTGAGLLISGIQVRRRRLCSFRKDK